MALLFMDGFDAGDTATKWTNSSGYASSTTTRFSSGRSLYLDGGGAVRRTFTPSATVFVGFAFKLNNGSSNNYITLSGDGGATAHLNVRFTSLTGISIYRGSTLIASGVLSVGEMDSWNYLEISATLDDASGSFILKINGVILIDFTGDTRNGGTSTDIDALKIDGWAIHSYIDDMYICSDTGATNNTFLGDVRVQTLVPTGAGSSTQMTPSTGANWETVDELPYSATDYVTGTSGQVDTYQTSDLLASTGTIYGVQANTVARKTDAGNLSGRTVVKSGSTTSNGTTTALGTSDVTISTPLELDPDTAATWTSTGVNGIEIGTEAV